MHVIEEVCDVEKGCIDSPERAKDIFLFSHPRTASNLLCRLLSGQSGWLQSHYHFDDAFDFARETFNWNSMEQLSCQQRIGLKSKLQEGAEKLQEAQVAAAKEGKLLFAKDHTFHLWEPSNLYSSIWNGPVSSPVVLRPTQNGNGDTLTSTFPRTNPTIFPDTFLRGWTPVFIVRHPALVFESWYRAESSAGCVDIFNGFGAYHTTLRYSRTLYDWFLTNDTGSNPVIIEADDIMGKGSTMVKFCQLCGMDSQLIRYEWEATQPPEKDASDKLSVAYMSTFWGSTSIDATKSSQGLDLETKHEQWKHRFGSVVATQLLGLVEAAMPDYDYLKARKL